MSRFGNSTSAPAHRVGAQRGGAALGTIASLAAPFIIKKVMAKRTARRGVAGAT